ncbi:acetate--CoA ligase family protein [Mesorhizobium sp. MSK_1335]|uniref:Acetate--CoA ligase family protein n=1 Tax=Mesorhizobium montanum TaxID=3072323 RepID=A0ABU4ZRJ2_9HYPH|nr:acetate--CoA ligase family protein [Mesorhizobium sp. MSK_1335]MDX8527022.1 acetate--CoA ligase family protein [Mesorhizobium sp. MSK_1335]
MVSQLEKSGSIAIVELRTLSGTNIYSVNTVIKLVLEIAPSVKASVSDFTPRARSALSRLFPECALNVSVSQYIADAIQFADRELCREMNFHSSPTVAFVGDGVQDKFSVVWESDDSQMSRAAALAVVEAVDEAARRGDPTEKYTRARDVNVEKAKKRRLSNSTAVLVATAKRKHIPFEFVAPNHLRLGQGKHQKQLFSTISGSTSFASAKTALDKRLGNRLLAQAGMTVPRQITVRTKAEAVSAAKQLGKSVVVKPIQANQGRGVSVKLRGHHAVEEAFERAYALRNRKHSENSGVLVEQYVAGSEYRATVVDYRLVAAVLCSSPEVIGDGEKTLRDLIEELNREPDRDGRQLSRVEIDDELLRHIRQHRLSLESVPVAGKHVILRPTGHLARGGVPMDVTGQVHPENQQLCERIAKAFGLSIAGIDLIMPDIAISHKQVGCSVLEVNARPGIEFHLSPRGGASRDVSELILANLYEAPELSAVATLLVLGDRHTSMMAKAIDRRLQAEGRRTGLLSKRGAYIDSVPQELGQRPTPPMLTRDPFLDALIYAASPERIWTKGLGLGACHVVSVMPSSDENSEILDDLFGKVLQRVSRGYFIVDREDIVSRRALSALPPPKLILVSARTDLDPDLRRHLQSGGLALFMRWSSDGSGAKMILASASEELAAESIPSASLSRPPLIRAEMDAMAVGYLAKKDGWFNDLVLPPVKAAGLSEMRDPSTAVRCF